MAAIFENDLKYSVDDFEVRKKFYDSVGIKDAEFVEYNTDEEKELQRSDIDVMGTFKGRTVGISEKVRRFNYRNDILVEMWSIFEDNVPGWLKNSKAEMLACFFNDKIVMIHVPSLKEFLHTFAKEHKDFVPSVKETANEMIKNGKIFGKLENFKDIFVAVADNDTYHTVSVIFKTKDLEKNGVKLKEYA